MMEKIKAPFIVVFSALMSWLGILAVPVLLLVACNVIDYLTGLAAAPYRGEAHTSYKGIRGIIKKVCMWLLVGVGSMMDIMINYAAEYIGLNVVLPFVVATVVAVWLVFNELISILENMVDIGVKLPPFLLPLVKNIKTSVEKVAESVEGIPEEEEGNEKNVRN